MPASQTLETYDGLEISAEPLTEPHPVFYTEENPKFRITIKNDNAKFDFIEGSSLRWTIETDPKEVVYTDIVEFGPLDDGDEISLDVGGSVLAYEGHGVFGVSIGNAKEVDDSHRRKLPHNFVDYSYPLYSFSVWDKSHYQASVRQPKRLQIGLLVTSVALIFFALIQIYLSF